MRASHPTPLPGTWGKFKPGPSKPAVTACFYQLGGKLFYNTGPYLCACYQSSFTLTWSTTAACATSTTYGAATRPGVCRFSKHGTTQVHSLEHAAGCWHGIHAMAQCWCYP